VAEGGLVLDPFEDWEVRGPDDVLVGLVLAPIGNRRYMRILTREGRWRLGWGGGPWRFLAQDEETHEPVAMFERHALRPGGGFLIAGGVRLRLRRGLARASAWTLATPSGEVMARFYAPRSRHREQALRFEVVGDLPERALLVPFAAWVVIELHRHEKRLWRSSRSDDPDRFGGVFGDGGGAGGGGDGGGGAS
jgi:uncharacterized membrane protein YgcG